MLENIFNKKLKKVNIREETVLSLYEPLKNYSKFNDEHGLYLPPDFATRPADWSEEVHKMVEALGLLYDELHGEGKLYDLTSSPVELTKEEQKRLDDLNAQIQDGLSSLGKQLFFLTEQIYKENK